MKQINKLFLCFAWIFVLLCGTASAQNRVSEIDITVTLRQDGSAYLVQNWQGEFSEGTENYIPIRTDGIEISQLKVSDQNGSYTLLQNWDIDADFREKAQKCGILQTEDGVELCFGISQYGKNRYAIEYVIDDFVKSYTDCDGTNFMLINPQMSTFPTDGHIRILMENGTPLTEENARIWGFGYDGYVEFQNGEINAYTTSSLDDEQCMIIMFSLEKGILTPVASVDDSFDIVIDRAFEGSDYTTEASLIETIIGFLVPSIIALLFICYFAYVIKHRRELKKFVKEAPYFREIPNGGDLLTSHFLAQNFDVAKEDSAVIGALLLSMIQKGCLKAVTEETTGFFGNTKETVSLQLANEPTHPQELELYRILQSACGSDGILQEKELERYASHSPETIHNFVKDMFYTGEANLLAKGGFIKDGGNRLKDLSDSGKQELAEVVGLQKYLSEFSLISERSIGEVTIWKEYLTYAVLFDIADRVMEQFKEIYPEQLPQLEQYQATVLTVNSYRRGMYLSAQKALQQKRMSGAGGKASLGGGGGFSGGGMGGGSR